MDFPDSPKVSKGEVRGPILQIEVKYPKPFQREVVDMSSGLHPSTEVAETSNEKATVAEESEDNDLDIHGNIRPSGVSTLQSLIPKPISSEDRDRDITDTGIVKVSIQSKSL